MKNDTGGNHKHGYARKRSVHPMYAVWLSLRQRCRNPKSRSWAAYGGRGIDVCERWNDFKLFVEDMGTGYGPGLSIDRIDNDKGYSPENCRWATPAQQGRNHRRNVVVTAFGKTQILQDWAAELGVTRQSFYYWTKKGYSYEDAVKRVGCQKTC